MSQKRYKILLDGMYIGLVEFLEVLDWEVKTIQDADLHGAKDREVVMYAKKKGLLLVTSDKKAAELAKLMGVKYLLVFSNAIIAKAVHLDLLAYETREEGNDCLQEHY